MVAIRRAQALAVTWMVLALPAAGVLAGCSSTPASPMSTACALDLEDRISAGLHEEGHKAANDMGDVATQLQHAADHATDPAAKTALSTLSQDLSTYADRYVYVPPPVKWTDKFTDDRRAVDKVCGR